MVATIFGLALTDPFQFSNFVKSRCAPADAGRWHMATQPLKRPTVFDDDTAAAAGAGGRGPTPLTYGFLGVKAFVKSFQNLPASATVVVFDIHELLCELSPIQILDPRPRPYERLAGLIFSATSPAQPVEPVLHRNDYIWSIIGTMKSDAFLHAYNTFFYRIAKENRDAVKSVVMRYLCGIINRAQFEAQVLPLFARRPRGQDPVEAIYNLVNSEQGAALKAAVTLVQKGRDADAVAEQSSVSAFEIRYILSQANPKT